MLRKITSVAWHKYRYGTHTHRDTHMHADKWLLGCLRDRPTHASLGKQCVLHSRCVCVCVSQIRQADKVGNVGRFTALSALSCPSPPLHVSVPNDADDWIAGPKNPLKELGDVVVAVAVDAKTELGQMRHFWPAAATLTALPLTVNVIALLPFIGGHCSCRRRVAAEICCLCRSRKARRRGAKWQVAGSFGFSFCCCCCCCLRFDWLRGKVK